VAPVGESMRLKIGVTVTGVRPEMVLALRVIETVYEDLGAELTVTSITDGKHMDGSRHYEGRAADLRSFNVPASKLDFLIARMKEALGPEFDVVKEGDHVHVEHDRDSKGVKL
jgi:hypothetical protein